MEKKYTRIEAENLRDTYKSTYYPGLYIEYSEDEQQVINNLTRGYYEDLSEFYSDLSMIYESYKESNNNIELQQYSLIEYLLLQHLNTCDGTNEINDYSDLSDFLNYNTGGELWAYSIDELDYCIQENKNVCLVIFDNGNKALAEL